MNDDELLALVAEVVPDTPPPAGAVAGAYAAFGWRTVEADLAQLLEDSQPEVVGFHHGPPVHRVLTFQTARGTIEVAIGADHLDVTARPAAERILIGRPDPAAPAVELVPGADGRATAPVGGSNPAGLRGPVRLEVGWPGGPAVTPWFTL